MAKNDTPKICHADDEGLKQAADFLRAGDLIAFPTETVYGLGGNALNQDAVRLIYQTKNRPAHNPLIIHIADFESAENLAHIHAAGKDFLKQYWAGPLTVICEAKIPSPLAPALIPTQGTIALRMPSLKVAQNLIQACGFPLAAPSANISGKLSPTRAKHVLAQFAPNYQTHRQPKMILTSENEFCQQGIESTIIDIRDADSQNWRILRAGTLLMDSFPQKNNLADGGQAGAGVATEMDAANDAQEILASGMLSAHYAPETKIRLNATAPKTGELMLGFGKIQGTLNLSPEGDLQKAAYNFYNYLYRLDRLAKEDYNISCIAIASIPLVGNGVALNDRLTRAAYANKD